MTLSYQVWWPKVSLSNATIRHSFHCCWSEEVTSREQLLVKMQKIVTTSMIADRQSWSQHSQLEGSTTQLKSNLGQELKGDPDLVGLAITHHRCWCWGHCPTWYTKSKQQKGFWSESSFRRARSDSETGILIYAGLGENKRKKREFSESGLDDNKVLWEYCFGEILFQTECPVTRSMLIARQYTDFISISNTTDP